jgi:carbon storage regulator
VLVLTRKPGESIIIAGDIRITVVDIGHGRVRLGIEAPESMTIDREEIHAKRVAEAAAPQVVDQSATAPLHNRIADRLPPTTPPTPSSRRFPPRKPR